MTERERPTGSPWLLQFESCDPQDERRREALLSLGNGVVLVRGAAPWVSASTNHYPGTYHAGTYNTLPSEIAGETVCTTALVNLPNWLVLDVRPQGGDWLEAKQYEVIDYQHSLDIRHGVALRRLEIRDREGRETRIEEERLVSMASPQLAALRLRVTPQNWSGTLEIRSGIEGDVTNDNVERYHAYVGQHLSAVETRGGADDGLIIKAGLSGADEDIVITTRTHCGEDAAPGELQQDECSIAQVKRIGVAADHAVVIDKSARFLIGDDGSRPRDPAPPAQGYVRMRAEHCAAWERLWSCCPVVSASPRQGLAFNFHIFHLLQNFSPNSLGQDIGFPARSWQEAYHGHIFWDEIFVAPVLMLRLPALVREMLLYRFRRLDAARANARQRDLAGALYPWRSARSGAEETPVFQKNPRNGRWNRDHTQLQTHINAAIAWDICRYVETTGDTAFVEQHGLEMLVEIARCFASLAQYDARDDRFDIAGIVGPDEYHTRYPGADAPGIRNNTYTNVMVSWTLRTVSALPETARFDVSTAELDHWRHIAGRLRLPFGPDGLLLQFEGFDALRPIDIAALGSGNVDWTLDEQGEDVNHYQVSKQADLAMLLYLFTPEELVTLIGDLGYHADRAMLHRSLTFALGHTSHGSSLSRITYAGAFAHFDAETSWRCYNESLGLELEPAYSESSKEGVHLGAMAGTLDVLQRIYLGLRVRSSGLWLDPTGNPALEPVRMDFTCRFGRFTLDWDNGRLALHASADNEGPVRVHLRDRDRSLTPGGVIKLGLDQAAVP